VRLFFESMAATAGTDRGDRLTSPRFADSQEGSTLLGTDFDPVEIRLGVAVIRGLLIDVLVSGDVEPATNALLRFVDRWWASGR
jgi:hypothetical protein